MASHERGLKLRCRDGHFEMAAFELHHAPEGYWMWVACEFAGHQGGHWLRPDHEHEDRIVVVEEPYCWGSVVEAFAARDHWEEQEG